MARRRSARVASVAVVMLWLSACVANPTPHPGDGDGGGSAVSTDEPGDEAGGAPDPTDLGTGSERDNDTAATEQPTVGSDATAGPAEDTWAPPDEADASGEGPSDGSIGPDAADALADVEDVEVGDDAEIVDDAEAGPPDVGDAADPGGEPPSWLNRLGGHADDEAHGVAGHADGSLWTAGYVTPLATFGGLGGSCPWEHWNTGGRDAALARYAADGTLMWARTDGGPGRDEAEDVSVTADGAAYVTGTFANEAIFDLGIDSIGLIAQATGPQAMYVARYEPNGMPSWVRWAEGSSYLWGRSVLAMGDGGVIAVGSVTGSATFGAGGESETTLTSVDDVPTGGGWANATDIYVARYDASGGLEWARHAGGAGSDGAEAIAPLGDGFVIGGSFTTALALEGGPTLQGDGLTAFLAAYDGGGAVLWAAAHPNDTYSIVDALAAASGGVVALVRDGSDGSFLVRYGAAGQVEWTSTIPPATALTAGVGDALIVAGLLDSATPFGDGLVLDSGGELDSFVAIYTGDGAIVDAQADGGPGYQVVRDIALAGERLGMVGRFSTEITLWADTPNETTHAAAGSGDTFVASIAELPLGPGACGAGGCPAHTCEEPAFDCGPSVGWTSLAGVHLSFPEQPCTFTLAEAAAGIEIAWELKVLDDVDDVTTQPTDGGGCGTGGVAGIEVGETLAGGEHSYCICDVGLCAPVTPAPFTLVSGTYPSAFEWDGVNWFGPSDFGNPKGDPFPPGQYTLTLRAHGTVGVGPNPAPYTVVATFGVELVE